MTKGRGPLSQWRCSLPYSNFEYITAMGGGPDAWTFVILIEVFSMTTTEAVKPPIDKKALLAKYIQERDKRLRTDGNEQYLEVKGRLAHYLDDPYTPLVEREPKTDHVTFAFVGGGFAGLVTGARLVEAHGAQSLRTRTHALFERRPAQRGAGVDLVEHRRRA